MPRTTLSEGRVYTHIGQLAVGRVQLSASSAEEHHCCSRTFTSLMHSIALTSAKAIAGLAFSRCFCIISILDVSQLPSVFCHSIMCVIIGTLRTHLAPIKTLPRQACNLDLSRESRSLFKQVTMSMHVCIYTCPFLCA